MKKSASSLSKQHSCRLQPLQLSSSMQHVETIRTQSSTKFSKTLQKIDIRTINDNIVTIVFTDKDFLSELIPNVKNTRNSIAQ